MQTELFNLLFETSQFTVDATMRASTNWILNLLRRTNKGTDERTDGLILLVTQPFKAQHVNLKSIQKLQVAF